MKKLLLAGIAVVSLFAFMCDSGEIEATGGAMQIVAPTTVGDGAEFTADINVTLPPIEGYVGFQEKVTTSGGVQYLPSVLVSDEVLAPGRCTLPVRTIYGPDAVLVGCVNFPLPAVPYTDATPAHRLTFSCVAPGGDISLTTGGPTPNLESIFVSPTLQELPVGSVNTVSVSCPAATATPTVTPTATATATTTVTATRTATATPTATSTPIPVDTDGDGCFDGDELALGLDPANPFDYSDFDRSGAVDVADIAIIVHSFGLPPGLLTDRTGDGLVSVGDISIVVRQFGLSC